MGMGLIQIPDPSQRAIQGMQSASATMARQDRIPPQAKQNKTMGGGLMSVGSGAMTGATIGSVVPGIGTGIGALAGGILGGLSYYLM